MKRSMIALGCILVAGPAVAQSIGERTGVNSALGISPTMADFIKEAANSDMLQIAAATFAQEKGNAEEKKFAEQMMTDHSKTSSDLKSLVDSGTVKAEIPTALDSSLPRKSSISSAIQGIRPSPANTTRCKLALIRKPSRCSSAIQNPATIQS
jgi:putative membrane protein